MSRSVRDLRELINVSRLSYRDDDELDELCNESEEDFSVIPVEVYNLLFLREAKIWLL